MDVVPHEEPIPSRRLCLAGEIASVLALGLATVNGYASPGLLLSVAVVFGASRAFFAPANTALGPMLVPRPLLPRAAAARCRR